MTNTYLHFSLTRSSFAMSSFSTLCRSMILVVTALFVASTQSGFAQGILRMTAPPSGGNQKAAVTQYIGLVKITIEYSRPSVITPQGEDRTGKIWGQVVPWGMSDLGFAAQGQKPWSEGLKPWRAGANENTTISFSHDVVIEGRKLAAGLYGFHIIPDSLKEWTLIFSSNSSSWGSYFYKESEDVLRVSVKPQPAEFHQYLAYEFTDCKLSSATAQVVWEKLKIPFKIEVPNIVSNYISAMRNELRGATGYDSKNWQQAAQYCLENNTNLQEALQWADYAVNATFVGRKTFPGMSLKAQILVKLGKIKEADALMKEALPLGEMTEVHLYGRQLLAQKRTQEALEIFKLNAQKHPNEFTVNVGLARGYSAAGDYKQALSYAKAALAKAPDAVNKAFLEQAIKKLESGKDMNS